MAEADIEKADELWRDAELQDTSDHLPVYKFLKEADSKHPDNVHLKWRLARACKDMSETSSLKKSTRQEYAYEGKDIATRSVELDPNVWEAQQFMGTLLGVCSGFEIWNKLGSAREMKECFKKACDLAGDSSPEPYHCLGSAEYGFADAGTAASLLGLKGTYQGAYDLFMKAESLCPHKCYPGGYYKRNWLMIIKALMAMKKKEEAKEWQDKLLAADIKTPDDKAALAEAKEIKIKIHHHKK